MAWISIVFAGGLLALSAWLDWEYRSIPVALPVFLFLVGMVLRIWEGSFPQCLFGTLPGLLLFLLSLTGQLQIGPGDGLMLAALGIWESAGVVILVLIAALFLAAVWGVFRLRKSRLGLRREYPFLPFLFVCFLGRFLWI